MSDYSHSQPESHGSRRAPSGSRGLKRRTLILDTAADLIVSSGLDALNTNALAERAQISVGSVYQYFADKKAILTALAERFFAELSENTVSALDQDLEGLTARAMVDVVVDPMIAFDRANPAFGRLSGSAEMGGDLAAAGEEVDRRILAAVEALLRRVSPEIGAADLRRNALVTKSIYKSMSYLVQHELAGTLASSAVDAALGDLKHLMAAYLREQLGIG